MSVSWQQETYEEKSTVENPPVLQTDGSGKITEVRSKVTPKSTVNKEASQVPKTGPNGMIIRGMTFYKSEPEPMAADDGEPGEHCKCQQIATFKLLTPTVPLY